ncbi:MAG: phosphoribosylglycinamide formyltransferase [Bacteroidetes bacterium]|nr:phosphoribosylglycinamide formyltransferase [Bacteroidota bacterium]
MQQAEKHIAIFASGGGSNARKIIEYFRNSDQIAVKLVVVNKRDAGVLEIAESFSIETLVISRTAFANPDFLLPALVERNIDYIALAGFLWLVPAFLVDAFPRRILNIHPALLPKYGGKGMYGHFVHEAVKAANERESGMTIHLIDNEYDRGETLFQVRCHLEPEDSAEQIAAKVLALEHRYYAAVLEQFILKGEVNADSMSEGL